jgi:hypothetical protein
MINFKEYLDEGSRGLWDNIHAKRKRIKAGSGERMRKPGSKGAPTDADFKAANEEVVAEGFPKDPNAPKLVKDRKTGKWYDPNKEFEKKMNSPEVMAQMKRMAQKEELEAQFDLIEEVIEELALAEGVDPEFVWETLELVTDEELLEYAIDKKGHKSSTGGLTQKGVDAYNAKTGGNLQTAVTTPPSKLKPGSKAANRRKSFCARMGGMEGAMKKPNGEPTRKALALKKWNC